MIYIFLVLIENSASKESKQQIIHLVLLFEENLFFLLQCVFKKRNITTCRAFLMRLTFTAKSYERCVSCVWLCLWLER